MFRIYAPRQSAGAGLPGSQRSRYRTGDPGVPAAVPGPRDGAGSAGGRGALREITGWCADYQSAGLRRGLQIALGMLWLLDAALQYQPFMFGSGFVRQIIVPAEAGNPAAAASVPLLGAHVISATQPVSNAMFATAQLLLGLALLWRPSVKAGLTGSVAWGLLVWWLGEGLGGVLADGRLFTGAPGAAVLYALLAMLVWPAGQGVMRPRRHRPVNGRAGTSAVRAGAAAAGGGPASVADGGLLGRLGSRLAWFTVWASSAFLALEPANRAPRALQQSIAGQAGGEPAFLASLDRRAAALVGSYGLPAAVTVAIIAILVGGAVFIPAATRPALVLAALLALAVWVVGENFGGILTGQGTDPNSGPLLILLAAAFWPTRTAHGQSAAWKPVVKEASAAR